MSKQPEAPTTAELTKARESFAPGLTKEEGQAKCAALIWHSGRAWQKWENGERAMHHALWHLWKLRRRGVA